MLFAREKADLDWDSINRFAQANKDFTVSIEDLKNFCLKGKAKTSDWD